MRLLPLAVRRLCAPVRGHCPVCPVAAPLSLFAGRQSLFFASLFALDNGSTRNKKRRHQFVLFFFSHAAFAKGPVHREGDIREEHDQKETTIRGWRRDSGAVLPIPRQQEIYEKRLGGEDWTTKKRERTGRYKTCGRHMRVADPSGGAARRRYEARAATTTWPFFFLGHCGPPGRWESRQTKLGWSFFQKKNCKSRLRDLFGDSLETRRSARVAPVLAADVCSARVYFKKKRSNSDTREKKEPAAVRRRKSA